MTERRTRSGGAARGSGPRTPSSATSLRRSQRKSGSDLPNFLPELSGKEPHAAPVRKPIVLKKIVAHAVEVRVKRRGCEWGAKTGSWPFDHWCCSPQIPAVQSPRRSSRIAFFLEKENNPPNRQPTKEELFKTPSIPVTPTTTPMSCILNGESNFKEGELDARDLDMSKKVRRSYSRLEILGSASTSTPGQRSYFGFGGPEGLSKVSPVVCGDLTEVPAKLWAPDTTLPGISPPILKEKRKKKKVPEILKSELDEWAAAMNAEFEAAEQFDLLIE
ncbi:sororin-like isoform 1-T1 [Callospermophilus lateralis]|uniref:sororin-like isoform X1 n=1 Tax=Callospermophilus lateralis TaxID=76772 RepID=UPI00403859BC